MRSASCLVIIFAIAAMEVSAQDLSNRRGRLLSGASDTIRIDSLRLIPGSVILFRQGQLLQENVDYRVNYEQGWLLVATSHVNDSLYLSYKVFYVDFNKVFSHKDVSQIEKQYLGNPFIYIPESKISDFYKSEGLNFNGSLSRGISFGNNQSLVVNSNLNLQISGRVNNEFDLLAAISDDNNPIQPEGNTQQLQDFDRVFVQVSKDSSRAIFGDFEMTRPPGSYFMNYYKKSRGVSLATIFKAGKGVMRTAAEGAVSRGRFARNLIAGGEGNQGPYRLTGTNGEIFIIIISGTERVYLDGQLLTRGEQNDYIIDYNTGEITFMPGRLITQYSRIIVEFQYSDRNYARSVFHIKQEYEREGYRIKVNYFSEQDHKNQPFQQELTDNDKQALFNAGDQLENAFSTNIKEVKGFNNQQILYRQVTDSTGQKIFEYADSAGSDTLFYQLGFSYVGENKGNYAPLATTANGRVYQFVGSIAGVKQGAFEPIVPLISPKQLRMLTVGADVKITRNSMFTTELAGSDNNINTFSALDKENDQGWGLYLKFANNDTLWKKSEKPLILKTDASFEHADKKFTYVERYRSVEFDRIWNRQLVNTEKQDTGRTENIGFLRSGVYRPQVGGITYQLGTYNREGGYDGLQNLFNVVYNKYGFRVDADAEWVRNQLPSTFNNSINNRFNRQKADLSKGLPYVIAGIKWDHEQSEFLESATRDTLLNGSYAFNSVKYYLMNHDTARVKYHLDYTRRLDFLPRETGFAESTRGQNASMGMEMYPQAGGRFVLNFTYRLLELKDSAVKNILPDESVLSRIEYDVSFLKKIFSSNTYYQVGTGQELKREFTYIKVQRGFGNYSWIDYNKNEKEELNEFVIPPFQDTASYIKFTVPTTVYIKSNSTQFSQTLNINPGAAWSGNKGIKKMVSRFSNLTAYKMDRRTFDNASLRFLDPFYLSIEDTNLLSISSSIRNTFFYNRSNSIFGFDLNWQDTRSKLLLNNGFDSRQRQEKGVNIRWNLNKIFGLTFSYNNGYKKYISEFFTGNNYDIIFRETKPRLLVQFNKNLRMVFNYTYYEAFNSHDNGNESTFNNEIGSELKLNIKSKGMLNAKFSVVDVNFKGESSSPVSFELLQGLQDGRNSLWTLGFQQRLSANIQVNISYDGRKSQDFNVIHIGRVEARYLF